MKKTLSYIVLSLLILNAFAQDFSGCDSLWGVWTSFPKEEPFRVVETDVGNFLTIKPYAINDRITIVPSNSGSSYNYPILFGDGFGYRILDVYKSTDGYIVLLEYDNLSRTFYSGKDYSSIVYRFQLIIHFVDENTCWFESERINGKRLFAVKEGKENLYWRERAK